MEKISSYDFSYLVNDSKQFESEVFQNVKLIKEGKARIYSEEEFFELLKAEGL